MASTPSPAPGSCARGRGRPSSRRTRARWRASSAPTRPACRPTASPSRSPEETEALGELLGRAARGGELIGLVGELGAGKTCLVRGLARGLDIDPERVHSPSFTIVTEYPGGRLPLAHVDLYRLEAPLADPLFLRDVLYGD